jgi:hypothetical protein
MLGKEGIGRGQAGNGFEKAPLRDGKKPHVHSMYYRVHKMYIVPQKFTAAD